MKYNKHTTTALIKIVAKKEMRMNELSVLLTNVQDTRDEATEELIRRGIDIRDDSIFEEALK